MSRKASYAEKGKAIASPNFPPRIPRVRVPAFNNSELRKKHSLTIIGRLTNPEVQRMWSMIPFFADRWKTSSRPIGADLGQGRFQFQFSNEQDLLKVLDNQPYHFSKWMIILQRWEPTSSSSFPSKIPFWIDVKGIPVHLWSEETLYSVAKGVGHFVKAEITATYARVRVVVDGLQPLVKQTFVDFADGEEALADLIYDKLASHCKKCNRLDHEDKDCPDPAAITARNPRPSPLLTPSHQRSDGEHPANRSRSHRGSYYHREPHHYPSTDRKRRRSPDHHRGRDTLEHDDRRGNLPHEAYGKDRSSRSNHPPSTDRYHRYSSAHRRNNHGTHYSPRHEPRERPRYSRDRHFQDHSSSSVAVHGTSNQVQQIAADQTEPPSAAINTAMCELRDVMVQYVNCADPTESAARKERYRQAEESGQVEEAALQMVRASLSTQGDSQRSPSPILSPSQERIPANLRLGPMVAPPPLKPKPKKRTLPKKKLGRPPLKKKGGQKEQASPRIPLAGTSKRRKTSKTLPSPRRRLDMDPLLGSTEDPSEGRRPNCLPPQAVLIENQGVTSTPPVSQVSSRRDSDFQAPLHGLP